MPAVPHPSPWRPTPPFAVLRHRVSLPGEAKRAERKGLRPSPWPGNRERQAVSEHTETDSQGDPQREGGFRAFKAS